MDPKELVEALVEKSKGITIPDSLIEQVASNIVECAKYNELYSVPFSIFQQIISKTEKLSVSTISKIFSGAVKSYSSLAYSLLPLIDCGKIGPQKALLAIAPLFEGCPLLHEVSEFEQELKQATKVVQPQQSQQ